MEFHFKKGVYRLNEQSNFDFQLNRVVMWDGGDSAMKCRISVVLPVMMAKAKGKEKDVILLHGGNDSYFEEFFMPIVE